MNVIDYNTLRKIIAEEVKAAAPRILREGEDESKNGLSAAEKTKMILTITEKAGTLLNAIESFEEECPEVCMSHTSTHISALKKILDNMRGHAGDYVEVRNTPNVPGDIDSLRSEKD